MRTTISGGPPVDVNPTLPPAPRPSNTRTIIALSVLGLIIAVFAAIVVTSEWVPKDDVGLGPAPFADGAPEGDFFIPIDAVGRSGERERQMILDRIQSEDPVVIEDSIVHLANAVSPTKGSIGLYRWNATDRFGVEMQCFGEILGSGLGSTNSCGPIEGEPHIAWGVLTEGSGASNTVSVFQAPAESAWMIVTSFGGQTIVSPVVDGVSYAEWSGENNSPAAVVVTDADGTQLWTQLFN